jgi:hypothetical protein
VIPDQVESGRRHERREFLDELERFEEHVGRAVAPPVLEAVEHAPVREQ